ncbi:MAG: hypothetical protein ACRDZ7_18365 [Acidimicrobiia bacterium]
MIRVLLRRSLRLGMLGGLGYGLYRTLRSRLGGDAWQSEPWISTGTPGGTVPSPSPASVATPVPSPVPDKPAAARGNGEATPPQMSDDPVEGNGQAAEGTEPGRPPGPPARAAKPKRGPARKAPTGKAEEPPDERLWVQASDGVCPPSHPVKAKLSSKIFHSPGARNYNRTHADRCYPDEASAQADGLRPALR